MKLITEQAPKSAEASTADDLRSTVRQVTFPHADPGMGNRGSADSSWRPAAGSTHPIHQVKATLQVYVGSATVSVGELLAASKHQVLLLDRTVDQAVDLLLEGQVVARGQLVAVNDRFAIRITEIPLPIDLARDLSGSVVG